MIRPAMVLALVPALLGLGSASYGQKTIGIAMPTQSTQRWIQDGANMKSILEARGYRVDLQYAEDDINAQVTQIENMITKGDAVLVIASIDGESLTNVLEKAHEAGIPVIAYDRLIRNSPYVSYYATFDNYKVGVLRVAISSASSTSSTKAGPFNIEIFAGSPDDNNAGFFFRGAMSQLEPYIKSGKLVVRSGQTDFARVAILRWDGAVAQKRMDDILSSKYTDARIDAVLSPYDGLSIGILSSLKSADYGTPRRPLPDRHRPGCGAPLDQVDAGRGADADRLQGHADPRKTRGRHGRRPRPGRPAEVNDLHTYYNGRLIVPSFLCDPVNVDITNYESVLIDTGYYTASQLGK